MAQLGDPLAEVFEDEHCRVSNDERTLEGRVAEVGADGQAVLLQDAVDPESDEPVGAAFLAGVTAIVEAEEPDAAEAFLDRVGTDGEDVRQEPADDEEPEPTPAIRRVDGDAATPDEEPDDEDLVIVSTGANGPSKYHRDGQCAYAARLNNPRERPLSVLGDHAEPCSNCCPEADESAAVGEAQDVDLDEVRADAGEDRTSILDALQDEGELPGTRLKTLAEIGGQAVYNSLSALKDQGVVEARKDPDDGRRKLYSLAVDVEEQEADEDDADVPEGRSCHCGEFFDTQLEYLVHRTEEHDIPRAALNNLQPGEFVETVEAVESIPALADELGFRNKRTIRLLQIYDLEDVVGPDDVEISEMTDVEFDGVADEETEPEDQGDYWCGYCAAGPFDIAEGVRDHHEDEGHPGDGSVRTEDPRTEVENAAPSRADGGAAATSGGASRQCQNCGSHVTKRYAAVHTPEGEDNPRACPNCDNIREADGTVRQRRDKGGGSS